MREAAAPFAEAIATHGAVPDIQSDGMRWWERIALNISVRARSLALAFASKAKELWQDRFSRNRDQDRERGPDYGREREPDDDRGFDR
jgi:hypothetical protein